MPAAAPLPRGPSVLTLYSAADLLSGPGCPVCRYAAEASDRYLRWFALEGHSQPTTITQLCASLGMCAVHTRRLMSQPGAAVRLTAVYRYVVIAAVDRLAGRARELVACPACEHDDSAARRALETLLDDIADPSVLERLQELGGLCLPHLDAASAAARPRLIAPLLEATQSVIASGSDRCDCLAGTDHDAGTRTMLREAVAPGRPLALLACSPCLAGAQAERDVLIRLPGLASDGPDPALVLCASHLADAAADAAARGLRRLLAWQAQCLALRTQTRPARRMRKRPRSGCAACRARRAAAQRVLADLGGAPNQGAAAPALCVRHHLSLRAADPRTAGPLARAVIGLGDQLATELGEDFDRAARAHSQRAPAPGSTTWLRAAAFLDGSVFSGLSEPPPVGAQPG